MRLFLHSTNKDSAHLEYEVLSFNAETKMGVLTNLHINASKRSVFESNLSKEVLKKNKWVVSKKSYDQLKKEAKDGR